MAFQNAQGTDARYGIFSENHPGSAQTIIVTNNINSNGPRAASARFDSNDRQECLEGTRKEILENVNRWINIQATKPKMENAQRIFWINGLAGSGKTTIAYTVAKRCKQRGILGATFFCSRDDADSSNPKLVFTTIADQLGQFYAPFGEQVALAHIADPGLRYSSVSNQLEELLVKPLHAVRKTFPFCLVIVDALDECKDDNATSIILSSLSRHITTLAPLKFLVTSRPEQKISGGFRLAGLSQATQHFNLHEVKLDVVEQDIEKYLKSCFKEVKEQCELDDGWPAAEDIRALTRISSGLFIFAATAVKFVRDPNHSDPCGQLSRLLTTTIIEGSSPHQYLDQLYMQVLTNAFPDISGDLSSRLKKIMGTIALLQYPLYPTEIERLLHLRPDTIRNTTLHLGSVLIVPKGDDQMIRLIHPSFFDFLTNATRCSNAHFAVDSETQHGLLARACLDAMQELKRNICGVEDPTRLDSEVENLSQRIATCIPPYLQYASRHWAYHLSCSSTSNVPLEMLRKFCSTSLLHWVEVCSLLGELRTALVALDAVCRLVSRISNTASDILELLIDCERFIREFFPAISAAASQTYYSALPFTPTETLLREKYSHELERSMKVRFGVEKKWGSCLRTMEGHPDTIWSVVFSPDGAHVASGSGDDTIRIWEIITGAHLHTFRANSMAVSSVAFSPKGDQIASGSNNNAIQLWDVASGAHLRTLKGHTLRVTSVVFSPDGTFIASGSNDRTVRLWTAHGDRTLSGHTDSIVSVAFSRDSAYVTSGSFDKTIRIWDTDGTQLRTLKGHSSHVQSVAFSPDGTCIASGSKDSTLRIWHTTGTHATRIFRGHSADVNSVAYSPNGAYIISGSLDETIRMWDVNGTQLQKFKGHSGSVTSVAFSPNGVHVASASVDKSIRIWDTVSGNSRTLKEPFNWTSPMSLLTDVVRTMSNYMNYNIQSWDQLGTGCPKIFAISRDLSRVISVHHPMTIELWDGQTGTHMRKLRGHSSNITSLAFSPIDAHIASGSRDQTIRIWDSDGTHLRTLRGHTNWVLSVAFSPNGSQVAAGSFDTNIRLWDANNGRCLRTIHAGSTALQFSSDGSYIASASSGGIHLFDAATGKELRMLPALGSSPDDISISADQKFITLSYSKLHQSLETPEEFWLTRNFNLLRASELGPFIQSEDGWIRSISPKRRLCWIPFSLRAEKFKSGHGGILSVNATRTFLLDFKTIASY